MSKRAIKRDIRQLEKVEGRAGADTIRLWESYREQAFMWRALALLQMPATALAIAAALIMYFFADTIIEVPERPQPGHYSVKQLPDSEFISVATETVNLIASYQPAVARNQFRSARKFLWEPALSVFETDMMGEELRAIEETGRSQLFFINTRQTKVERFPDLDKVVVRLSGTRQKLIGNQPLPATHLVYYVKMTTIPRNTHNEYGIVVIDVKRSEKSAKTLRKEDKYRARQEAIKKKSKK